jgi:hypothetical protein
MLKKLNTVAFNMVTKNTFFTKTLKYFNIIIINHISPKTIFQIEVF